MMSSGSPLPLPAARSSDTTRRCGDGVVRSGNGPVTVPVGGPRPVGFPGCRSCWYRTAWMPEVCLACVERAGPRPPSWCCPVCGRGRSGPPCDNPLCARADRGFSTVAAVGPLTGALRAALLAYKYGGRRGWAPVFARLLAGKLSADSVWFEDFELLVPVPAFAGVGARRDWDPLGRVVALLADRLAGWEVASGVVGKVAETPPLAGRSRFSRTASAESALRRSLRVSDASAVRGRRVLVLDDVLTRGSTLREVSRVLLGAGAVEVAGLVLARAPGRPVVPGPGGAEPVA